MIVGYLLLQGSTFARVIGIALVSLNLIAQFAYLPSVPVLGHRRHRRRLLRALRTDRPRRRTEGLGGVSSRKVPFRLELEAAPAWRPATQNLCWSTGIAGSTSGRGLRPKGLCPRTPARNGALPPREASGVGATWRLDARTRGTIRTAATARATPISREPMLKPRTATIARPSTTRADEQQVAADPAALEQRPHDDEDGEDGDQRRESQQTSGRLSEDVGDRRLTCRARHQLRGVVDNPMNQRSATGPSPPRSRGPATRRHASEGGRASIVATRNTTASTASTHVARLSRATARWAFCTDA